MNCPVCGKENVDSSAFCEHCGGSLRAQPAAAPGMAPPGPVPAAPQPLPPAAPNAQVAQMNAVLAAMSMGEKISAGGALAAVIGFFLPWISVLGEKDNGLDLAKDSGGVYFILLIAIGAAVLSYLSSKAMPSKKLLYAGYLVLLGALCGPTVLLSLLFVSQIQSAASIGLWLLGLGYTAIAVGGLMTIRAFSRRTY